MPLIVPYYRNVASVLLREAKAQTKRRFGIHDPVTKEVDYFKRDA